MWTRELLQNKLKMQKLIHAVFQQTHLIRNKTVSFIYSNTDKSIISTEKVSA